MLHVFTEHLDIIIYDQVLAQKSNGRKVFTENAFKAAESLGKCQKNYKVDREDFSAQATCHIKRQVFFSRSVVRQSETNLVSISFRLFSISRRSDPLSFKCVSRSEKAFHLQFFSFYVFVNVARTL